jgi:hypothetical protein
MPPGIQGLWRAREGCEQGGLGDGEDFWGLVEIGASRCIQTIGVTPEIDPIEVLDQDLLFVQTGLEAQGRPCLPELPFPAWRASPESSGQLLGDGAPALDRAACLQVGQSRSTDGHRIDASVVEEAMIFRSQKGLDDDLLKRRTPGPYGLLWNGLHGE